MLPEFLKVCVVFNNLAPDFSVASQTPADLKVPVGSSHFEHVLPRLHDVEGVHQADLHQT